MRHHKRALFGAITCAVFLTFCLPAVSLGQPQARAAARSARPFDPSGRYTFQGERPPAMKDFSSVDLIAAGPKKDRISGDVTAGGEARGPCRYKIIPARVADGRLSFETQSIDGISYSFTGRVFKRRLPQREGGYDVPRLEGTLVKFRQGRRLGEISGEFKYEEFGD